MKRAVVLGGSGFIGRWLCGKLMGRGWSVVVIDLARPAQADEWIEADARDADRVAGAVKPGDVLVHLFHSSVPFESMDNPEAEREQNVIPYERLLDRLADSGVAAIVYSSTGGQIYGEVENLPIPESASARPVSEYGKAKLEMEKLTRAATQRHGLPHLILRIGNPYGPYQELTNRHGVVPALFKAVIAGSEFVSYGKGATVRDYIYIDDAAEAVARLIEAPSWGHTVNIGTGRGTSLAELVRLVEKVSGKKLNLRDEAIRPSDVKANALDIALLEELTGFAPKIELEQGLGLTWEYLWGHEKD